MQDISRACNDLRDAWWYPVGPVTEEIDAKYLVHMADVATDYVLTKGLDPMEPTGWVTYPGETERIPCHSFFDDIIMNRAVRRRSEWPLTWTTVSRLLQLGMRWFANDPRYLHDLCRRITRPGEYGISDSIYRVLLDHGFHPVPFETWIPNDARLERSTTWMRWHDQRLRVRVSAVTLLSHGMRTSVAFGIIGKDGMTLLAKAVWAMRFVDDDLH